jgi:2'-5' RNA ligase
VFLAIFPPPALAQAICGALTEERAKLPPARWVEAANLHLTLHFFGERSAQRVAEIVQALGPPLATIPSFDLRIGAIGSFPRRKPRVVWLGVEHCAELELVTQDQPAGSLPPARTATAGPTPVPTCEPTVAPLAALRQALDLTLPAIHEEIDSRPLRAHLTLARCKAPWSGIHLEQVGRALAAPGQSRFSVLTVDLVASKLSRRGSAYEVLHRFPLSTATTPTPPA